MYKNQLQELAQRSCFNFPAYSCIREGPDHAPRFKATVNFSGETFESPTFCSTLRQAEHAAAEVALNALAKQGPSRALAAKVLDETGVYKSLLQETAHKAGLNLPIYTTIRSGRGHVPTFSCTVEIAGLNFVGDPAGTKKQAQKNAAISAWSALRKLSQHHLSSLTSSSHPSESKGNEDREQVIIARVLSSLRSSSKNVSESDHRHRFQKSETSSLVSSLPTPGMYLPECQHCGHSSLFSDATMYQIWQQEQIMQQQNHIFTLTVPQTIPPVPHMYPLVQPAFQLNHCLYFPARDIASVPVGPEFSIAMSRPPSFYFANQFVPDLRGTSTVTIREIQEEKEDPQVRNSSNETRDPTPAPEDEIQKHGSSKSRSTNVQLGGEQSGTSEWASYQRIGSVYRPINIEPQNPPSIDTSCPIPRAHSKSSSNRSFRRPAAASSMMRTPATSAASRPQLGEAPLSAPPRMRTGVPGYSSSIRLDMVRTPTPRFMAPAVRIRSVVPVYSAHPRRSVEEASKSEEKGGLKTEVESRTSSELGNLRMSIHTTDVNILKLKSLLK